MPQTPSQYIVNRGVLANDGKGDTLRDSFGKLQEAIAELYVGSLGIVDTTGVVNGNTLVYDSNTGAWKAGTAVVANDLNDLSDVTIAGSLTAGMVLKYNGATFINSNLTTDDVTEGGVNEYYTNAKADARVAIGIANLVDSAPATLDTLNELAAALGDDPSFATTITTALAGKEPTISAGTTAQYYRGDKTFQALNTDAVVEASNEYYTNAKVDTRIAATNIGGLNNVNTAGVVNNAFLRYNSIAGEWQIALSTDPVVPVGSEVITGANGVLTSFTLSTVAPTTTSGIVSVNGVIQEPNTAYSISGTTLTFTAPPPNGARIEVRAIGGGEPGFLMRTSDFNAEIAGRYGVDTSGGMITATLPAVPTAGQAIYFMDAGGAFGANTFTVDRNGNTINGAASNLAKTTNGESFGLMYTGSTWRTY